MAEISWRAGGFSIRIPTLLWAVPLTSCPGRPSPLVPLSLRPRSNSNPTSHLPGKQLWGSWDKAGDATSASYT